jgi:hypothetical protein
MKSNRHIAQIISIGMLFAANAADAESTSAFFEGFEGQECQIKHAAGDSENYQLNKASVVTKPAHSGKQSCMIDVATGSYLLPFLYLTGENLHIAPEPGQKFEGWMRVEKEETSADVGINLGISVFYPKGTSGGNSAQIPLKIVESRDDGWQKFQSEDLLEFFTNFAEKQEWHPEGLFVTGWLLHLAGGDLKNKHVVVYIDDLVIK